MSADTATYGPDAHLFRPERWTDPSLAHKVPAPYHFSYGAGARGCTAIKFSNRILYAIFARLILSFKIKQSETKPPRLHYVDCTCNAARKPPLSSMKMTDITKTTKIPPLKLPFLNTLKRILS